MRLFPLLILVGLLLAGCATPENRREQYGPFYSYKPIRYTRPPVGEPTYKSPSETTVWYGPDQRRMILGTWGQGGHRPYLDYPCTPWSVDERIISRFNTKGLRAQQIADRELRRQAKAPAKTPPAAPSRVRGDSKRVYPPA